MSVSKPTWNVCIIKDPGECRPNAYILFILRSFKSLFGCCLSSECVHCSVRIIYSGDRVYCRPPPLKIC
jgi:hypothetical protein